MGQSTFAERTADIGFIFLRTQYFTVWGADFYFELRAGFRRQNVTDSARDMDESGMGLS